MAPAHFLVTEPTYCRSHIGGWKAGNSLNEKDKIAQEEELPKCEGCLVGWSGKRSESVTLSTETDALDTGRKAKMVISN